MNKTSYIGIYKQAVPYMEANASNLNGISIAVFIGFLVFGIWAYFASKKKSFIPLIILIIIGSGISGFLAYTSINRLENSHPYIVTGKVEEVGYDILMECWFFTIKGNKALEIHKDGSSEKIHKKESAFYYRTFIKKGQEIDNNPMSPYFYSIYDNLKAGKNITLLIIPKEKPLGYIKNGKLNIELNSVD